ncbi:unnamed protein product [Prunus brigantina]
MKAPEAKMVKLTTFRLKGSVATFWILQEANNMALKANLMENER